MSGDVHEFLHQDNGDHKCMKERLHLPPRRVPDTSALSIGACLLTTWQTHVLNTSFRDFVNQQRDRFYCFLFAFVCDSAAANLLLLKWMRASLLVGASPLGSLGTWVLVWHERCGLHQCGRISAMLLNRFDLLNPVYSLHKLFHQRRYYYALSGAIRTFLKHPAHFQWHSCEL
jgi:hypothetical protein